MKNIKGQRFSKLVALEYIKGGYWKSLCDCGNIKIISGSYLRNSKRKNKSCGCYTKKFWMESRTKHGMSRTHFYRVFRDLMQRCKNEKYIQYHLYGGRGIKCLWKSFDEFRDDMYESYLDHKKEYPEYKNTSIERINNNGNYSKENCCWATHKIQQNNKSTTPYITYRGKTLSRKGWSKITGVPDYSIYNRIKGGWSLEEVFNNSKGKHATL